MMMTRNNEGELTPVRAAFKEMMLQIKIAQTIENLNCQIELTEGAGFRSVADVAAVAWDHAFDLCKDLIETQSKTAADRRYLDVAGLIDDMFMTESAYRDELADRAAEQRAEMSMNGEEDEPDLVGALQLLTWPAGVTEDFANGPESGYTP